MVGVRVSGDGWVTVADGSQRWGRFGAAGVLARHLGDDGEPWYFLARRSHFCHRGGTWAIPGGAVNLGETPLEAAVREFTEEIGPYLRDFEVAEVHEDDHGGWCYWTHVVDVPDRFPPPEELHWETAEARWVRAGDIPGLELFDAFEETLRKLGLY